MVARRHADRLRQQARYADPDRTNNTDIWVVDAKAGATPQPAHDVHRDPTTGRPAWSPDGKLIAYLQGDEPRTTPTTRTSSPIVPSAGGAPRMLTDSLDRASRSPRFSQDGNSRLVPRRGRSRRSTSARVPVAAARSSASSSGRARRRQPLARRRRQRSPCSPATPTRRDEVFALENGSLRQLSHQNDAWLARRAVSRRRRTHVQERRTATRRTACSSSRRYAQRAKYPTLLRIHGGPNGQDQHAFSFERELLAATAMPCCR